MMERDFIESIYKRNVKRLSRSGKIHLWDGFYVVVFFIGLFIFGLSIPFFTMSFLLKNRRKRPLPWRSVVEGGGKFNLK